MQGGGAGLLTLGVNTGAALPKNVFLKMYVCFQKNISSFNPPKLNPISPRSRENDPQTCLKIPWKYGPIARHMPYPSGRITFEKRPPKRPGCRPFFSICPKNMSAIFRGTVRPIWLKLGVIFRGSLAGNPPGTLYVIYIKRSEIRKRMWSYIHWVSTRNVPVSQVHNSP